MGQQKTTEIQLRLLVPALLRCDGFIGVGCSKIFKKGYHPSHSKDPNAYGQSINFFSWSKRELIQSIDLGEDGVAPLEIRFYLKSDGKWTTEKVIDIPQRKYLDGWRLYSRLFLGEQSTQRFNYQSLGRQGTLSSSKPSLHKRKRFYGAPQMLQLSLDGKRLYVSTSIFSPWDRQFYPDMVANGGKIVKLDVDTVNGGLKLDENFLVDFGEGLMVLCCHMK
ncbi:hypothetical protein NQ317_014919 [Molorchus minor]|uniref:Selenium-binding protein n=1 Tax=Molorchus minor TaxID=1323400 RepID=A0ABQ9JBX1_9CUCU|nr:hypothetical protein NQ317_014919 [Molorchus minor]